MTGLPSMNKFQALLILAFLILLILTFQKLSADTLKPQFVTIVNFVRGSQPGGDNAGLAVTVSNQLEAISRENLPATFLLEYNVLINPDYIRLLNRYSNIIETGAWLEMDKPLIESAG